MAKRISTDYAAWTSFVSADDQGFGDAMATCRFQAVAGQGRLAVLE